MSVRCGICFVEKDVTVPSDILISNYFYKDYKNAIKIYSEFGGFPPFGEILRVLHLKLEDVGLTFDVQMKDVGDEFYYRYFASYLRTITKYEDYITEIEKYGLHEMNVFKELFLDNRNDGLIPIFQEIAKEEGSFFKEIPQEKCLDFLSSFFSHEKDELVYVEGNRYFMFIS